MPSPDNIFSSSSVETDKAEAIRFISGVYAGKTGWLRHSRRKRGSVYFYVFVDLGDNKVLKTHVHLDSIGNAEVEEPKSYAAALLQQHIDIEATMSKLVRQLATCSIGDGDTPYQISKIFVEKLHDAIRKQENKGSKARYRYVHYDTDDDL
jgi:hypothetical protein